MSPEIRVDEARILAHEQALQTDPRYRQAWERHQEWLARRAAVRAKSRRQRGVRTLEGAARATDSQLPSVRVFVTGKFWRDVTPRSPLSQHYDFTEDVRELVLERIRFDVFAEWTDPREQWIT
jgi:hypothetical protein